MNRLEVMRIHPDAQLPRRAHPGDAGLDLFAVGSATIPTGERLAVATGIAVAIAPGFAGLVVPRSGLARNHGVTVANAPGLIDSGYRGELLVVLVNLGQSRFDITTGERVAQLVIVPISTADVVEVAELPQSDGRESGGFGSTGR